MGKGLKALSSDDAGCIKVRRIDGLGIVIMKSFIARFCKQAWSNNEYPARI
jgi:hypothetical protein